MLRIAGRKGIVYVVKYQSYLCHAHGFVVAGSIENHIFHLPTPKLLGALFPHAPPNGVHDIALATPIGPHNTTNAVREGDLDPIHEGFEA